MRPWDWQSGAASCVSTSARPLQKAPQKAEALMLSGRSRALHGMELVY
jgi:hypothetical protein